MINEEDLVALKPEGFDDAQWKATTDKFMELHNNDINGLVNNEAALKREKVEIKTKLDNLNNQYLADKAKYEQTITGLNDTLAKNSPDAIKNTYEAQLNEQKNLLETTKTDFAAKQTDYEARIKTLEKGVFERDCLEDFNKAIAGKNLDTSSIDAVRQLVMGENYSKFNRVDLGGGNMKITSSETGKDISASVADFLATPTGKRFLLSNSSGGGADGGSGKQSPERTEMKRSEFEALDPRARAEAASKYRIVN